MAYLSAAMRREEATEQNGYFALQWTEQSGAGGGGLVGEILGGEKQWQQRKVRLSAKCITQGAEK